MTWILSLSEIADEPREGNLMLTFGDEVAAEVRDAVLKIAARPVFEREAQTRLLFDMAMTGVKKEPEKKPKPAPEPAPKAKGTSHTTDFNGKPSKARRRFVRRLFYLNADEPKLALTREDVKKAWDAENAKSYSLNVWGTTLRDMFKADECLRREVRSPGLMGRGWYVYYVLPTACEKTLGADKFALTLKQDVGIVKGSALV